LMPSVLVEWGVRAKPHTSAPPLSGADVVQHTKDVVILTLVALSWISLILAFIVPYLNSAWERFGFVKPTNAVVALAAFALALSATRYLKKHGDFRKHGHVELLF